MCDMLQGSVERIISSNWLLQLLEKLRVSRLVIQKRQQSYLVTTQVNNITLSALHWKSTCIVYCNFSSYKLLHQWQRPGCQSLKGSFYQEFFNFESLRLLPCITSFVSGLHPKSLRTILVHVPCSAAISLLNKQ